MLALNKVAKRCFETMHSAAKYGTFQAYAQDRRIPNKTRLERRPRAKRDLITVQDATVILYFIWFW